jgi:hypothetical protein
MQAPISGSILMKTPALAAPTRADPRGPADLFTEELGADGDQGRHGPDQQGGQGDADMGQALELHHEGHAVERSGGQDHRRAEQDAGLGPRQGERQGRDGRHREPQQHHVGGAGLGQHELAEREAQAPAESGQGEREKGDAFFHGGLLPEFGVRR